MFVDGDLLLVVLVDVMFRRRGSIARWKVDSIGAEPCSRGSRFHKMTSLVPFGNGLRVS